jgi:mutator protein MutT
MITCTFEDGGKASLRHVVVHAIVENDGKLLLVKRAPDLLEGGKWSLPSGFLDRGETASQCVLRELREETGWEGQVISFFRINTNPNRPHEDRQNVALDFIVKSLQESGEKDQESTEVRWIAIDELPPLSSFAFDHGESIQYYLKYRTKNFSLPIMN